MMDYRPSLTPEEQRKLELLRHASYNTAPRESTRIERLPPPQQAMISPSELSRLSLANIEARMASQGALAARVQAAQQAHAQAQVQNMQMMGRPQLSPALLSKHRLAFHPSSPIKQGQRPYSPQKQSVGGYRSPMRQPTYYRSQNEFSSFPSPASSFLSPAEHAHAYPSPASFPSSTTSFPSSAGSFPSSTGRIRSPAEGLNMLRAVSLGMRGDRSEGLPPMLAPPLTSHMAPPQSHPPLRHNSNASMDDMSTSTIHPSEGKLYIDELQPYDVLCGRGGKSNHHPGNKRYRHVVSEMKMMYRKTEAKAIKTDLSRAIVEHVCNYGGRFIKREENSGRYYVLTKSEARKKTSQALRETKELKWTA